MPATSNNNDSSIALTDIKLEIPKLKSVQLKFTRNIRSRNPQKKTTIRDSLILENAK